MTEYTRKNLDIERLLELGDLDIRGMAVENEGLSADEYFSRVECFIKSAPQFMSELADASKLDENIRTLRELESKLGVDERSVNVSVDTKVLCDLENIKNVLTEIGYGKLNFDIASLCNSIRNGDLQKVEKLANEVLFKFRAFFDRIKGAYSIKKFAGDEDASDNASEEEVSLGEALEYMDYKEENRKMRILAVDDVAIVLNTVTSILSPYYEVYALKNSAQVESFLTHKTPELFLLDIEMDEINGFDLVPLIRRFEKHKNTPIIFLTGNASFNNLKDAIALGACDFIKKPLAKDVLLEKIKRNIVRIKAY